MPNESQKLSDFWSWFRANEQFLASDSERPDLLGELDRRVRRLHRGLSWEFYPARQPKIWDYRFQFESEDAKTISLDATSWSFVLLKYPDGAHEILLKGSDLPCLTDNERWHAAAIVLESILGELALLERVDDFDLVSQLEPHLELKERPIRHL